MNIDLNIYSPSCHKNIVFTLILFVAFDLSKPIMTRSHVDSIKDYGVLVFWI